MKKSIASMGLFGSPAVLMLAGAGAPKLVLLLVAVLLGVNNVLLLAVVLVLLVLGVIPISTVTL